MKTLPLVLVISSLAACGGNEETSTLSLSLTDAPVSGVSEVNIHINSIELKKNSETFTFEINQVINLLDLQGSTSTTLLEGQVLPAGRYQYVRLDLDSAASNIVSNDSVFPFSIPSEDSSGLKLNSPFELSANGNANFTLDFDVAKSLTLSSSGYKMRPTLRIVDNSQIGHIAGDVASELIADCDTTLSAYAFNGSDAELNEMTDTTGPITSATVSFEGQNYAYELGYLEAGDYTVHLVCGDDDPTTDDGLSSVQAMNISVESNKTAKLTFDIPQV